MNHKEDFFSQLSSEFPEHPLKQRYLSELRDHLEDLEDDLNLEPHQLTSAFMSKKLGSPKEIKNNFFDVMLPLRHLIFAMESLLWGSLLVPPVIYIAVVIGYLNSSPQWLFLAFLTLLGAILFFGLTYQLLLSRGLALEENWGFTQDLVLEHFVATLIQPTIFSGICF